MRAIACSLLCLGMGWVAHCYAQQPGELDSLFHFDGKVILTDFDSTSAPVIVPTADLGVVVGFQQTHQGLSVSRMVKLKEDGSIDPFFGDSGIVTSTSLGQFVDLLVQGNGQLVLVGKKTGGLIPQSLHVVVERFEPNGAVDTTYGDMGQVLVTLDTTTIFGVRGAELAPDGKLLAFGKDWICRFDQAGELDTTFGAQGFYWAATPFINELAASPSGVIRIYLPIRCSLPVLIGPM